MNTIKSAFAVAFAAVSFLTVAACGSSEPGKPGAGADKTAGSAKPAGDAAGTEVTDLPLLADVPAGSEANWGGSGFHSEDGSVSTMIRAVTPTDPKDIAEAKTNAELILFKKWIKSDKTADGWVLTYQGEGLDMDGKTYENFSFAVRRKVGSASYECYGAVKKQADLDKNIKICNSLKAKP